MHTYTENFLTNQLVCKVINKHQVANFLRHKCIWASSSSSIILAASAARSKMHVALVNAQRRISTIN